MAKPFKRKAIAILGLLSVLLYLSLSYMYGLFLEMTTYGTDLSEAVNRNLLAPWEPDKEPFSITSRSNCSVGSGPGWPRTRKNCFFVGNWGPEPCSPFSYGRTCATVSVPSFYFDDSDFREALRSALQDLCAVFKAPAAAAHLAHTGDLPMSARGIGCSTTGSLSLSIYIVILDGVGDPPIRFREGVTKIASTMYFSATAREITPAQP
jgi:hypothetical protein